MKWQHSFLATRCVCPALAFVAGFVDAATFVRAGGVFCAHITGNLIVIASQVLTGQPIGRLSAASLLAFVVTAALVAVARGARPVRDEAATLRFFLFIEACGVALAWLLGVLGRGAAVRFGVVLSLVVAMAVQTTLQRLTPGLGTVTTVMTGNLAQCVAELTAQSDVAAQRRHCQSRALILFVLGCGLGATSVGWLGFGALALPLAVLLWAATHDSLLGTVSGELADERSVRLPCCGVDVGPAE